MRWYHLAIVIVCIVVASSIDDKHDVYLVITSIIWGCGLAFASRYFVTMVLYMAISFLGLIYFNTGDVSVDLDTRNLQNVVVDAVDEGIEYGSKLKDEAVDSLDILEGFK